MMSRPPVWVVTGASRGLGRGIVEFFCNSKYQVVGCSRGESSFKNENYDHYKVDLTDERQVRSWVRTLKEKYGRVDTLVCNAGLVQSALFLSVTPTPLFHEFVASNLTATFLPCREFSKMMAVQQFGRIINIASIMTSLHEPGTAAYSSTKSAVIEMTKVLAKEMVNVNVTCNVVSPSMMQTETAQAMGEDWKARLLKLQTIPRIGKIEELCHILSFFAAPESSCITGQVLEMCLVS